MIACRLRHWLGPCHVAAYVTLPLRRDNAWPLVISRRHSLRTTMGHVPQQNLLRFLSHHSFIFVSDRLRWGPTTERQSFRQQRDRRHRENFHGQSKSEHGYGGRGIYGQHRAHRSGARRRSASKAHQQQCIRGKRSQQRNGPNGPDICRFCGGNGQRFFGYIRCDHRELQQHDGWPYGFREGAGNTALDIDLDLHLSFKHFAFGGGIPAVHRHGDRQRKHRC